MNKKPRILFYDIETKPIAAYIWSLGKQVVRHGQLIKGLDQYDIICITYCWNDNKPAKSLDWNYKKQNSKQMISEFDKLIKMADITIGKNSDSFDVKHINAQRFLHGLKPIPDWIRYTDDLQKQLKKYFKFPSQRLDYVSSMLGYGGKIKMEFDDWINIVEKNKHGFKSFKKMIQYGKKDVEDTRAIWNKVSKYIEPKFNFSTYSNVLCCKTCGSKNIVQNGKRISGGCRYQTYLCKDHQGYAGRITINKDGKLGNKIK